MIFNKLITHPEEVVQKVLDSIERQEQLLLTYLNQHCFNIYANDNEYRNLIDNQFISYQADLGMFLALKYVYGKKLIKIDATAMNQVILKELIEKKIPLSIVGGNFDTKFVLDKCNQENINLVTYHNGYFEENQSENIIKNLNDSKYQVFIIGMGVPQQELFAKKLSLNMNNKVIICVGNFLEFYFSTKSRAPVFIQKIGLEWMFRMLTEPLRLWKRYLIGIPFFIYRIIKIKFTGINS